MKIVILSSLYGVSGGGAGLVAEQLARGMADRGHEIVVITTKISRGWEISAENGIKIYRCLPLNFYPLQERDEHHALIKVLWQLIDIYNFHAARTLKKILAAEKPDVIHIHKMRGFSSAAWVVASAQCPRRVIQTLHDYESMSPQGTLEGRLGRWAMERRLPFRMYQHLRGWLSRGVTILTAPSRYTLDTVFNAGIFPGSRPIVIPNFHAWTRAELALREQTAAPRSGALKFLFIGRLEPEKGLRELLQAFAQISDQCPGAELIIAGWGSLEAEALSACAINSQIKFVGKVIDQAKDDLFSEIDLVVLPSTWAENSPLVILEAFAHGKPLIVSNIGGLPEFVEQERTGWLVPTGDVSALAESLLYAARHPDLVRAMIAECFQRVRDFSQERVFDQYEQAYISTKQDRTADG
jgi:glycosyltransferase involved in cell wall biosynthesis